MRLFFLCLGSFIAVIITPSGASSGSHVCFSTFNQFIAENDEKSFIKEVYNFFGNSKETLITEKNRALAKCFEMDGLIRKFDLGSIPKKPFNCFCLRFKPPSLDG